MYGHEELSKTMRLELGQERKEVSLERLRIIKKVEVADKNEDVSATEGISSLEEIPWPLEEVEQGNN